MAFPSGGGVGPAEPLANQPSAEHADEISAKPWSIEISPKSHLEGNGGEDTRQDFVLRSAVGRTVIWQCQVPGAISPCSSLLNLKYFNCATMSGEIG